MLESTQAAILALSDFLEERADPRAATVRAMGKDILAWASELERLQELEMVAGDLYRLEIHRQKTGVRGLSGEDILRAFARFFTPPAAKSAKSSTGS